ncbi:hypothetical protein SCP_0312310 [Sparassis crispa]|uniref:Uncharacterized protein n=1 Tax=Sparassis crispa TaxID=139825 RepID=A0A401GH68_9APHY|nr:hypothetical protein SCP_0312310 [Sparassis crispa]GBE81502.1 hypothetical protein SCP_0312310 [Sparassis crispa]
MDTLSLCSTPSGTKTSGRSSVAGSASIQSHVSAASSQHRLRTSSYASDTTQPFDYLHDEIPSSDIWSSPFSRLFSLTFPLENNALRQPSGFIPCLKWMLLVYAGLCVVFLSVTLCAKCRGHYSVVPSSINTTRSPSPLESLPADLLLSKASSIFPPPEALDPYVLKAVVEPSAVTGCVWSSDDELTSLNNWATRWKGPISLLLTTTAVPSSPEHEMLLRRLSALQTKSSLLNSTLSAHVLHLAPNTPDNPNAFLNLARLFAQTARVALFPGNFTTAPPKTLYASVLTQPTVSSAAMIPPPQARPHAQRPVVLTTRGQTGFPFSPLAPLVLNRDDPLWCTERFFPALSRAADWEECLWQVWLENFGDIDVRQTRGWLHEAQPTSASVSADLTVVAKLRRRLVAKYRSETCVLATRQLAALKGPDKALDAKKRRWLKRVCRAWTSAAQS